MRYPHYPTPQQSLQPTHHLIFYSTVPPIDPKLPSRRIAYFIFFVFAYIVYTFYTSNLLSNLVNDKGYDIGLDTLAESDYECVIVDYMKLAVVERVS